MLNDVAGIAVICAAVPVAAADTVLLVMFVLLVGLVVFLDCRRHCKAKRGKSESLWSYVKRVALEYSRPAQ